MYEYLSTLIDDHARGITDKRVPVVISHCGMYAAVGLPGFGGDVGILHLFTSIKDGRGWKRTCTISAPPSGADETFAKSLNMSENGSYVAALTVNAKNGECKHATVFRITPTSRLAIVGIVGLSHLKDKHVRHITVSNSGQCVTMPGVKESVTLCGFSKDTRAGCTWYSIGMVLLSTLFLCTGLTLLMWG